jgi:hypothetical protein
MTITGTLPDEFGVRYQLDWESKFIRRQGGKANGIHSNAEPFVSL